MKSQLKDILIKNLEDIVGINHQKYPEREDGFSTLLYFEKEIGHFHNFNELDLLLGKKKIKEEGLNHYINSKYHPKRSINSNFIELRFNSEIDINKIIYLVKKAISTN